MLGVITVEWIRCIHYKHPNVHVSKPVQVKILSRRCGIGISFERFKFNCLQCAALPFILPFVLEVNMISVLVGVHAKLLRSSLWLQFKPHHIAAGALCLAAKFLNMDLGAFKNIWLEFQTTPSILQDVTKQLMELF
ncbi:cyclin T1 [Senna tora]|uniref:Cyclin T1 n=1 Tax=Senna tora TaxID=362788 RepID=A0A834SN14_9FABA|nr:cyclin T1 [Senna tora]